MGGTGAGTTSAGLMAGGNKPAVANETEEFSEVSTSAEAADIDFD